MIKTKKCGYIIKTKMRMCAAILFAGTTWTSCHHDMDFKPYDVTDEQRVAYAEQVLGVTLDPNQDWILTSEYSVSIIANANLSGISKVAVIDGNPYAGGTSVMASAAATNGSKVTLSFRAPTDSLLYAVCMTDAGKCIARPFRPGRESMVSFRIEPGAYDDGEAAAPLRRAMDIIDYPTYKKFRVKDFSAMRNALYTNLPDKQNNTDKLTSDFGSKLQVKYNDFRFYELPLVFIGGIGKANFESDNDNLGYLLTTSSGGEGKVTEFLLKDHFKNAFQPKYDSGTKTYSVEGMCLVAKDSEGKITTQFEPNDIVYFEMFIDEQPIDEYAGQRVKVFQMNGELFVACEDGDDWDFNDRLFWFPYGTANVEPDKEPFDPIPSGPQIWTYAWEDKDFGDYDLNDCVIEVKENDQDKSKLDVTLVALGGARRLWLGFENTKAWDYKDYIPVFDKELHEVLGMPVGTLINTGRASADPVTITVSKPAGFDFQKCSFVLGAMFKDDEQGIYENDYYAIHIAKEGQDPHGIVIPGKWQWPKEQVCVKNAYPTFVDWAKDVSNPTAKNWYMYPEGDKVIKR